MLKNALFFIENRKNSRALAS